MEAGEDIHECMLVLHLAIYPDILNVSLYDMTWFFRDDMLFEGLVSGQLFLWFSDQTALQVEFVDCGSGYDHVEPSFDQKLHLLGTVIQS